MTAGMERIGWIFIILESRIYRLVDVKMGMRKVEELGRLGF